RVCVCVVPSLSSVVVAAVVVVCARRAEEGVVAHKPSSLFWDQWARCDFSPSVCAALCVPLRVPVSRNQGRGASVNGPVWANGTPYTAPVLPPVCVCVCVCACVCVRESVFGRGKGPG